MTADQISPWFSYTDEHGATISIHIPNLFDSVQKLTKNFNDFVNGTGSTFFDAGKEIADLKKKIKDLEAKVAQNRGYTSGMRGIK